MDLPLLLEIGRKTFYEAFREVNTEENMTLFLDTQFRESVLAGEMKEEGAVFFLAYYKDAPAGFTKVRTGYEPPELQGGHPLEVERIYVLKEHQDKKVGSFLMTHNIDYAKSLGFTVVWLGVWEENTKAIRFYERHGFSIFGDHIFVVGTDPQRDILMKKSI